jgi:protocatechuate 4,5-dioxygenase beta chain
MAKIIGGLTTSHVPIISKTIEQKKQNEPALKPFFDAFIPIHPWLAEAKPDVIVVAYNDHGTNFFLDNKPTFALGLAHDYQNTDEGAGLHHVRTFKGDAELSWHIAESLVEDEFDISMCQELKLDHACITAIDLLWPNQETWPVSLVPLEFNIVQHPIPKPKRCYAIGQAIGRAIKSYPKDLKVLVVASGGLSHQIGKGGFINDEFDKICMDKIVNDPEALTNLTNLEIVERAGSQGLEFLTWLVMRGAVSGPVDLVASTYYAPVSHTGGAVMLLDARGQNAGTKSKAA